MATITIGKVKSIHSEKSGVWQKYLHFCDDQMKHRTLWFLVPLMSLSAAVMPISIVLASYFEWYIAFVGVSILLFFGNIVLGIAEQHTRVTISFYLVTVLIHFLIPLIGYLICLQ